MNNKESRKKRKQGKSPEKDHKYDKQVGSATRTYSNVSKSVQKKAKLKKLEYNMTGALCFHILSFMFWICLLCIKNSIFDS